MQIVTQPDDFPGDYPGSLALVPTMGALHEGHLSLIKQARECVGAEGTVAVSIFVNPIQFDRPEDLASYPHQMEADLERCRNLGVDVIFSPGSEAMYYPDRSVSVIEKSLSQTLCGASRPGHFDGVCTVVLKLFNLIRPDIAVFGQKDYQQLAIIRRMVRDLNVPVEIQTAPTVREASGLAMSSRNQRLSNEQFQDAARIYRALEAASKESTIQEIICAARKGIQSELNSIDYLELVDAETLQPAKDLSRPTVLATAVFYGAVRLIDNILIPAKS